MDAITVPTNRGNTATWNRSESLTVKLLARHDTLIAIVGTAVLTAGYYWGIAAPGFAAASNIERDIAAIQARTSEFPSVLAERSRLQRKVDEYRVRQERLKSVLPVESHVSDVLHQVASLAQRSGLTINRLEPMPTIEFASYTAHPFHLSCRGTFGDIASFLNGLEVQSRLVTFGNIDFTRGNDGPAEKRDQNQIQASVFFNVYSRHAESTTVAENTVSRSSRPSDN